MREQKRQLKIESYRIIPHMAATGINRTRAECLSDEAQRGAALYPK